MTNPSFVQSLDATLSSNSRILTHESSEDFKTSMDRWTNYGLKVPFAIVQPTTEEDVVTTVKELVSASIPFVPAAGGHSCFSSIGKNGVIIDLSRFTGVDVHEARNLATVTGGTLMKEFQAALHPHSQFAAVGSGNTVGVLPYYLGGGISAYTPFCGYGCENIVAAKFVTAQGELIHVSEADPNHAELLWGIRGAGQFLGLFTQITVKTHPYFILGNELGQRIVGSFAFTVDKLDAVAAIIAPLMESNEVVSAGHLSIAQAPPDLQHQVLLVAPQVFATSDVAAQLFQPLIDLGPIMQNVAPSMFQSHSDHLAYLCTKGGFKRFTQNGIPVGFRAERFRELLKLHSELIATCPDAARSGFTVEWHSAYKGPRVETAFGLEGVEYWLYVSVVQSRPGLSYANGLVPETYLAWYEDPKNHDYMESMDKKAQEIMRRGDDEKNYISYTNTCRDGPLEWRYKGQDRIARLKSLKKEWDPKGVFTQELL